MSLDNVNPAFVLSPGPAVAAGAPDENAGVGQGVFGLQREQNSGYAQQWNLSLRKTAGENHSWELGYLGSKLTNLGVPEVNLNQLRLEQLRLGSELTRSVDNPCLRAGISQVPNLNAFAGFGMLRPDRTGDPRLAGGTRGVERWFDPAAFRAAAAYRIGNSGGASRFPPRAVEVK